MNAHGREDMAERRVARPTMILVVAAMCGGAGAGLYANLVVFGQPWS